MEKFGISKYYIIFFLLSNSLFACTYIGEPNKHFNSEIDETADYISIYHQDTVAKYGILFYPGGLVDASAYKSLANEMIEAKPNLAVLIIKMPMNLAVFSPEKGLKFMEKYNNISNWIIAGHSLGGSMAARVVHNHPTDFDGLVFLAAYPAESDDLSSWTGKVISLSAENDGLCTPDKIENHKQLLPPAYLMSNESDIPNTENSYTAYFQIQGGNHAQFGDYGNQQKDGDASISKEQQHQIIITTITQFTNILWE